MLIKTVPFRLGRLAIELPSRPSRIMFYLVLLAGVLCLLSVVALLDPSQRRALRTVGATRAQPVSPLAGNIAEIAAAMQQRFGSDALLRVPAGALHGLRKEEQPCLTPIDCVMDKRCDGHCGCR